MVGYNGSQCSDTYSVAHQMDFFTQNVFDPAMKQTTAMFSSCAHSLLFLRNEKRPICHQSYVPFGSSPTTEVRNTRRPTPVKASVTLVETDKQVTHSTRQKPPMYTEILDSVSDSDLVQPTQQNKLLLTFKCKNVKLSHRHSSLYCKSSLLFTFYI